MAAHAVRIQICGRVAIFVGSCPLSCAVVGSARAAAGYLGALAARGNDAEAMRVYEQLRRRLRDELGIDLSGATRLVHLEALPDPGAGAH